MKVKAVSIPGESHKHPEDFYLVSYDQSRQQLKIAVGDWANNLAGGPFQDAGINHLLGLPEGTKLNGGVLGSTVAKQVILASDSTGVNLIREMNEAIRKKYDELGVRDYARNPAERFTGYVAHVLATPRKTVVTAVGDVRCIVDGNLVAGRTKRMDSHHNELRRRYIEETGDVEGAYNRLLKPLIIQQFQYQNQPGHEFTYPAIDGTETKPEESIDLLNLNGARRLLLWTDGYETPTEFTIDGLEAQLRNIWEVDPGRCKKFLSVGCLQDDRTSVEVDLDGWSKLEMQDLSGSFKKSYREVKR